MADNKCKACGQWSGKGHQCPPTPAVTTSPGTAPVRVKASPQAEAVTNRVALAQAVIAQRKNPPAEPAETREPLTRDMITRTAANHGFTDLDPIAYQDQTNAEVARKMSESLGIPLDRAMSAMNDGNYPNRVLQRGNITIADLANTPPRHMNRLATVLADLDDNDPIPTGLKVIIRNLDPSEDPDGVTGAYTSGYGESNTVIIPPLTVNETRQPRPVMHMPAIADHDLPVYVAAHEYGHARGGRITFVDTPPEVTAALSDYGRTRPDEGYAEAYAQWVLGDDDPAARWYADTYRWPTPARNRPISA